MRVLPVLALSSAAALSAAAPPPLEWPGFRGPNGSGVAQARVLPSAIAKTKNLLWRVEVPAGYSSPVLSATRVFLAAHEEGKIFVMALDRRTGAVVWKTEAPRDRATKRSVNTPVSSTPVTDGVNLYVFFEDFGLLSYGADGKERWRYPMPRTNNPYGMAASPVIESGSLIMVCDQDTDSFIMALDRDTGRLRWKTARPEATHGFATPVIWRPAKGPAQAIVSGSYQLAAYSVPTGEKLWWVWGMAWQAKSTPVIGGETLYVHSWMATMSELGQQKDDVAPFEETLKEKDADRDGKLSKQEAPDPEMAKIWFLFDLDKDGFVDAREWDVHRKRAQARNGLYAIRLGGSGDVTATHVLWRHEKSLPNIPSPVLYGGVVYLLKEGGVFTSLDAATGKVLKQGRLEGAVDPYYSSPVAGAGKIYAVSQHGKVSVVQAAGEWQSLSVADLEEECWATPAIGGGRLYIRTQKALYCFGETETKG